MIKSKVMKGQLDIITKSHSRFENSVNGTGIRSELFERFPSNEAKNRAELTEGELERAFIDEKFTSNYISNLL